MKAWVIDGFSGLDGLRLAELPDPVAAAGEVVLRVDYAALNPADRYLAEGQYPARPKWPHVLGRDAIGTVQAIGPGVGGIAVGDRRIVLRGPAGVTRPGTFAQFLAIPAEYLVPVPSGWTGEQAAGATLVYMTALQALTTWGELQHAAVLITGASGGVGVAAIQLAKAMNHTVVALSRGTGKQHVLLQIGADYVVDSVGQDWPAMVKGLLSPRRVDLAIDNIGGSQFNGILETLGDAGRISCVGRLAGPVPEFNTAALFFRRLRIGGVAVGAYSVEESLAAWTRVIELLAGTGSRPLVDGVHAFDALPGAFERLNLGPVGKVLLRVHGL